MSSNQTCPAIRYFPVTGAVNVPPTKSEFTSNLSVVPTPESTPILNDVPSPVKLSSLFFLPYYLVITIKLSV